MKYLENEHYFEVIDTYAKAYLLGFIAADGALVKSSVGKSLYLTITIKYEDRAILDFMQKELGSKHKLLEIRKPSGFDKSKMVHHLRLAFCNKNIISDILKYGITQRKSLTLGNIIHNIPSKFRDAFIIGYFDGDGSVTPVNNSPNNKSLHIQIRGTINFLTGICQHLNIPISYIYEDTFPQLSITHMKYIVRFFKCYEYLPFYYIRKYNKFLERINTPSYDKYKQVQTISSPTK